MSDILLSVEALTKSFGGQVALADVDLQVRAGEIMALAGPNGSGKSTLIKVMAGYHEPDDGRIIAFGKEIWPDTSGRSEWKRRSHFIHQDLGLIATLSTTENFALSAGYVTSRWGRIKWGAQRDRALEFLDELHVDIDVDVPVAELTTGDRTQVAIARALAGWEEPEGILFVDEPTATLHEDEAQRLFQMVRRVAQRGGAVIFVSHRSGEVLDLADRVAVLRDGSLIATRKTEEVDESALVELIAGRQLQSSYLRDAVRNTDVVLQVDRLIGEQVRLASFTLLRGEILGVAGLNGSGRDELPGLLFGTHDVLGGDVLLGGRSIRGLPVGEMIAAGMAFIPADRLGEAVVSQMSITENLTLPNLRPVMNGWWVNRAKERADVMTWIGRLDIRPPEPDKPVDELSGGNQQKVVMAKWLRLNPSVLVLDEPTQGVDVSAKAIISDLLVHAANDGAGVVVCSSEAKPLADLCHRVVVFRDGFLVATLTGEDLTAEAIVDASIRSQDALITTESEGLQ